jgi:uncharacterized membrane protein
MASAEWRLLAVIAAGYIGSLVAYSRLPGPYLTGEHSWLLSRQMIAFLLPTMAALTCVLFRSLWVRDPIRDRKATSDATYDAILFRIILFVIALHVVVLTGMVGALRGQMFAPRLVVILLGFLFVGVGNLLPRTRPNLVIGFRTSRTLANRGFWMHINRVGGYVTVGLGAVIVLSGILFSKSTIPDVVGTAALVGATVIVVSYRRYGRV